MCVTEDTGNHPVATPRKRVKQTMAHLPRGMLHGSEKEHGARTANEPVKSR